MHLWIEDADGHVVSTLRLLGDGYAWAAHRSRRDAG